VVTNGNYDYMMTYKFRLDGSMDVDIESTGFLQSHYYPAHWPPMSTMSARIGDYTGGSLHDHTYVFKVDLDIGGPTNTFSTMEYKVADKLTALNTDVDELWDHCTGIQADSTFACDASNKKVYTADDVPYLLYGDNMRYVERDIIQEESQARMNANPAKPKTWTFGDHTNRNKFGNVKEYALKLHDVVRNGLPDDHFMMPANSVSKQNLAVTLHKDDEYHATGDYDLNRVKVMKEGVLVDGSQMNIDMMMSDNENLEQQDLVAWVACATMHYPTSENMPMTNAMRHGFSIHPWNFFNENPTMDMPHYLRVMADEVGDGVRGCTENCIKEDPPDVPGCTPVAADLSHNFAGVW